MSKFTEEEWVIEPIGANEFQVAAFQSEGEDAGNRILVVRVNSRNFTEDMRLVAAAPKLYQALKDMLDIYYGTNVPYRHSHETEVATRCESILAEIDKE